MPGARGAPCWSIGHGRRLRGSRLRQAGLLHALAAAMANWAAHAGAAPWVALLEAVGHSTLREVWNAELLPDASLSSRRRPHRWVDLTRAGRGTTSRNGNP